MGGLDDREETDMTRRLVVPLAALALVAAACGGETEQQGGGGGGGTPSGPQTIQVQAEDYKFGGVPETLPPGEVTFVLENVGEEPHDFGLVRIKGDKSAEELVSLPQKQSQRFIENVGNSFAQPGQEGKPLTTELEAGRYGYACFVTTKDGTPHAALGMFGEFTVA
jgi:plastocyanin